jgi:hypothetical protein
MPRVIRTLCFEELGMIQQPLLDTPIGKLSMRQTVVYILFAVAAFFLATILSTDLLTEIIIAAPIAIVGISIFGRKVKTIAPEFLIYYLFKGGGKVKKMRFKLGEEVVEKLTAEKPLSIPNAINVSSSLDSPVKLVGVLRDPQTGRNLPVRPYDVLVDGEKVFSGVTDESGFFTIFFTPTRYGVFDVEVKPEKSINSQRVPIQVVPEVGA